MSTVGTVRSVTTTPPVHRAQNVTKDADGDNDGTRAASRSAATGTTAPSATTATAPAAANGKVDVYA